MEAQAGDDANDDQRREPATIIDLLSMDAGANIDCEPQRLGLKARTAEM